MATAAAGCSMTDWPKPTWRPIWLSCKGCRHDWDDWQPCHVPVETWCAHARTYHCPECGSDMVLLRLTPLKPPWDQP
jgi:hypothetical protein